MILSIILTLLKINLSYLELLYLRKGPDKNDSNNGNEHVGMQKRC